MIKKYYLFVLLLTVFVAKSQTTIVEEKFIENEFPIGYNFLPNKNRMVIQKGNTIKDAPNKLLHSLFSYNTEGFSERIIEKANFMNCIFSPTENSFFVSEFSKTNPFGDQYKLYVDGTPSGFIKNFESFQYFNDNYQFSIVNKNFKENVDFEDDALFLNRTRINSRENVKIKIDKPDLKRIKGDNFTNYANKITFGIRVNDSIFGLVSKSISKDYKSSILYRTNYNYDGKMIEDFAYKIQVPNKFLIYSNNGGGVINTNSKTGDTYMSDLAIHNFVVDKTTQEVYVYGLFGENAKSASNIINEPNGLYVFKFDKTGKKIWESIQAITDKKDFNTSQNITNLKLNLMVRNQNVLVAVSSENDKKGYIQYVVLDNVAGSKTKGNKIIYEVDTNSNNVSIYKDFLSSNNKTSIVNKFFDNQSLIALENNESFSKYVAGFVDASKTYFKSFMSKKGIWVLESDNNTYYKLVYFEN
jgi:hypothetical protein